MGASVSGASDSSMHAKAHMATYSVPRLTWPPTLCQALLHCSEFHREGQTPSLQHLPSPGVADHVHVSDYFHVMKTIKQQTVQRGLQGQGACWQGA